MPAPALAARAFPKDCQALVRTAEIAKTPLAIVDTVLRVNDARKRRMADRIAEACGGDVAGKTLAVLGLTFKPNTDDMRDSPSLSILPVLHEAGATDPRLRPRRHGRGEKADAGTRSIAAMPMRRCEGADALVLVTEWNEFRALDLGAGQGAAARAAGDRPAQHLQAGRDDRGRVSPITASAGRRPARPPTSRLPQPAENPAIAGDRLIRGESA